MINLDTVGRLGAGKLLVLDAASAADWAHIFRGAGYVTGVPVETVKSKLDSSDQASFHEIGIPAVQLFSGAHLDYHRPSDRADKIDTAGLAKVAAVLREAVEYLAAREKPLATGPIEQGDRTRPLDASPGTRRAGLGTIPDYAFAGEGYRLSGVVPGSPAEACGLREGDVIVGLDSKRVRGLREAAELLSRLEPGATVVVTYLRNGQERRAEATLAAR